MFYRYFNPLQYGPYRQPNGLNQQYQPPMGGMGGGQYGGPPMGSQMGPQGGPPMGNQMGPQGGPPMGPPPSAKPSKHGPKGGPGLKAVEPGAIRPCRFQYVYIWLDNGSNFWAWLTYVGRRSVSGYRWTGRKWVYFGIDLRRIDYFQCY